MNTRPPSEPGIYWAATRSSPEHWDLIVEVLGEPPYLTLKTHVLNGWPWEDGKGPPKPSVYGPKIDRPKP